MNIGDILSEASSALDRAGGEFGAPRLEAELLLCEVLNVARSFLYAHPEQNVPAACLTEYRALIKRRECGEPISYITGTREFWSMSLQVNPGVLIPRPETECLVEETLERLPENGQVRVADIGTGSGAIALALARERPEGMVIATDLSPLAVKTARDNAERLGFANIEFREGSWCKPLDGLFRAIVSNPPYLAEDDVHLQQGDCRWEPRTALTPGANALAAVEEITRQARNHLEPGGWLLFEHGADQAAEVRCLLEKAGYTETQTSNDLSGLERVTAGRYSA